MSGDEPSFTWRRGETLGLHNAVHVHATWRLYARDEVSFTLLDVWDPEHPDSPLLEWQDDLTTNLVDETGLLEQVALALRGAMGYLTPVV